MTDTLDAVSPDRLRMDAAVPDVYAALARYSMAATKGLDPALGELIKIRASQMNHCAFCLDMHVADARKAGETEQRVALLAAWEEAGDLFTERERAALRLTEAITDLADGHVADDVYARAAAVFDESELAHVIAAAVAINAWNRFGIATRLPIARR